ncbi:MAG: hypothetical protein JWL86_5650 [Rhizobium sp.]|nr:hypothetical protein [Rhizobium sp.]
MNVFIVRPFGKKPVTVKDKDDKDVSVEVDFDEIDKLLIQEALKQNGLEGVTTGVIAQAGNIRVDMFQMLITHDLVIADISIDNANVFYELGIRHGLRKKGTILLRFPTSGKDVPFDLKTDRYVAYDRKAPAAAVDLLSKTIKDTIDSMRTLQQKPDSPVFLLLPELIEPDPAKLIVVPREFQEAVERAKKDPANGSAMLALLGEEAKRGDWAREGLRLVGLAQRGTENLKAALRTWELIRKDLPNDFEANLQLATIFQLLGDTVSASQACERVLSNPAAPRKQRADARSQLARNDKAFWVADFRKLDPVEARRRQAITDSRLTAAFKGYMTGFAEDMNDYYSGINAFGLLSLIVNLAGMEPDAWAGTFPNEDDGPTMLKQHQRRLEDLRGAVRMALENARLESDRSGKKDVWLPPSDAQYALLTSKNAAFVKTAYTTAKTDGGDSFSVSSEARQVAIFGALGLFPDNVRAALEALGVQTPAPAAGAAAMAQVSTEQINKPVAVAKPPRDRVIVATGHRVDDTGRQPPRFPNTKECVEKAKAWLRATIEAEKAQTTGTISGVAGAASGTDLLFHEVCAELNIKTTIVLPIPVPDYGQDSVSGGGPEWVEKFNTLMNSNPPIVFSDSTDLPVWAKKISNYGVYQRGNIFMMAKALLAPNADVTLLALWNGKAGDGPGGTADMIDLAEAQGAKALVQDSNALFGLPK